MSKTSLPAPLTDRRYWRAALARLHPDGGGDHELFVWGQGLREHISECHLALEGPADRGSADRGQAEQGDLPARVPFPERVQHVELIRRALELARELDGPEGAILDRLVGYQQGTSGRHQLAEQRGATYKQAKYLAVLAGVDAREVYRVAETIPMSQAMAAHLISGLKEEAA